MRRLRASTSHNHKTCTCNKRRNTEVPASFYTRQHPAPQLHTQTDSHICPYWWPLVWWYQRLFVMCFKDEDSGIYAQPEVAGGTIPETPQLYSEIEWRAEFLGDTLFDKPPVILVRLLLYPTASHWCHILCVSVLPTCWLSNVKPRQCSSVCIVYMKHQHILHWQGCAKSGLAVVTWRREPLSGWMSSKVS